jgi:hypothetical protein
VILDHSKNSGYPQPWILRAKNSMQNAAFPGRNRILLNYDKALILKYSLIVYQGEIAAETVTDFK